MLKEITSSISTSMGRTGLLIKKFSPEILTTVGILGMVGTVILASRATLKVAPVIEELKDQKFEIEWDTASKTEAEGFYDKKTHTKELSKFYVNGAFQVSKIYGPTITKPKI